MRHGLLLLAMMAGCLIGGPVRADWPGGAIKIGVLTDLSGIYSDAAGVGAVTAVKMAAEDCLAGPCRGMTVDVIQGDHANKPDLALSVARQWVDRDGVDALADMSNAAIQLAIAPFVAEKNRVALIAGGTARLSGDACQPEHLVQWMWDTYVQVNGIAGRLTKPGTTWYLVTADYAFGQQFEADARTIVGAAGGRVIGSVRHPFPSTDLTSYLLQAQASGADYVALANAGGDTQNAVKAAAELGVGLGDNNTGKQKLVAFYIVTTDIKALGLREAAGLVTTEGFYWDLDDGTRRFSQRFFAREHRMPSEIQASLYSESLHYLKAAAAAQSRDAATVVRRMHAMPIEDDIVRHPRLRADGRMVHDYYVFRVKTAAESKGPWDLYTLVDTLPGDRAFRSIEAGGCPRLLKE